MTELNYDQTVDLLRLCCRNALHAEPGSETRTAIEDAALRAIREAAEVADSGVIVALVRDADRLDPGDWLLELLTYRAFRALEE